MRACLSLMSAIGCRIARRVQPARCDFALACGAAAIEAVFGYPDALFRVAGHPVTWMGRLIACVDRHWNAGRHRRVAGVLAAGTVIGASAASGVAATRATRRAQVQRAALASTLLAQRSLHAHVRDVERALARGLPEGRAAVSRIVGRDVSVLDEAGVARAAIESLAENFSDGIVAPLFWITLGGLPGGLAYKAANTLDSMVGHRTPRHEAFGWASARVDDGMNWVPARLSAAVIALAAGGRCSRAWRAAWRDARAHRSPNAGWPEAAMAGALGLRLGGPRRYGETEVAGAWLGTGRVAATRGDVMRALRIYRRACALTWAMLAAGWLMRARRS